MPSAVLAVGARVQGSARSWHCCLRTHLCPSHSPAPLTRFPLPFRWLQCESLSEKQSVGRWLCVSGTTSPACSTRQSGGRWIWSISQTWQWTCSVYPSGRCEAKSWLVWIAMHNCISASWQVIFLLSGRRKKEVTYVKPAIIIALVGISLSL